LGKRNIALDFSDAARAARAFETMKPALRKKISKPSAAKGHEPAFREIIGLIQSARRRAFHPVNTEFGEQGLSSSRSIDQFLRPPSPSPKRRGNRPCPSLISR
jgi:hypothetical protein